jgi:hypothetical protein
LAYRDYTVIHGRENTLVKMQRDGIAMGFDVNRSRSNHTYIGGSGENSI